MPPPPPPPPSSACRYPPRGRPRRSLLPPGRARQLRGTGALPQGLQKRLRPSHVEPDQRIHDRLANFSHAES